MLAVLMRRLLRILSMTAVLMACAACPSAGAADIRWQRDPALNRNLPNGVAVFRGTGAAFCAVYALIDADVDWRAGWSGREAVTPLGFAQGQARPPALVVNGGYFSAGASLSLVVEDGLVRSAGVGELVRHGRAHAVARAAFGRMADGRSEIRVVRAGEVPGSWNPVWAIGGGPVLAADGVKRLGTGAELFDDQSGIGANALAPRTAVALLPGGRLLLLVVDGRSAHSPGLSLDGLADLLVELGALEAMNLDGGGSSAMVVNGVLATHPSDRAGLRPVRSVLWIPGAP